MIIGGIQSAGSALPFSGSGLLSGRGAGGSGFGPAVLLGGSAVDFTQGLYNAFGQLTALRRPIPTASSDVQTQAEKDRKRTLNEAAGKISSGDATGGRALAQTLVDENPRDVSALHLIGLSYLDERDYSKAEKFIGRALALAPSSSKLQGDFNNLKTLKKSDDEVLSIARRKIKSSSHRNEALRLLFHLADRTDRRAETYLTMSDGFNAARRPVEALGALDLALGSARGDQLNEVIKRAEGFVSRFSEAALPHNILGKALGEAGLFDRSIRELKTAVDIVPEHAGYVQDLADGYIGRGRKRLSKGQLDSARADIDSAFRIDPLNTGIPEAFARIAADKAKRLIDGGAYSRALGELGTAASKAPDDPAFRKKIAGLYLRVAAHFSKKGENIQARINYTKAYDLDPDNQVAKRKMAELSFTEGLAELADNDYDNAIALLERSYQAFRANTQYRQNLAIAYDTRGQDRLSKNDVKSAIEDFRQGVKIDPANLSILTNLGNALAQQ